MRRLPDQPHRIARGVFAGSFIGFLPLPGLQFLAAWGAARLIRGNMLAALLATFNTNPLTTPFFAVLAMTLGHWMLGIEAPLNARLHRQAPLPMPGSDLWYNFTAIFGPQKAHWDGLVQFWHEIYLPYFIGALGPGHADQRYRLLHHHSAGRRPIRRPAPPRRTSAASGGGKLRAKLAEAAAKLKRRGEERR